MIPRRNRGGMGGAIPPHSKGVLKSGTTHEKGGERDGGNGGVRIRNAWISHRGRAASHP